MAETVGVPVPAPRQGDVFVDPRGAGRVLRVSWHAESATVVLSMWRGDRCIGTHRLGAGDVGRLVRTLVDGTLRSTPSRLRGRGPERPVVPPR